MELKESIYRRILEESKKQSGSYPEENYTQGWLEFDEEWLNKPGLTTWEKDRQTIIN